MDNQEIEDAQTVISVPSNVEEPGHQICKDEDCKHAGKPQPIGNYGLHGITGEPIGYCKECMTRKRSGGRKKKYHKDRPEDIPPATSSTLTIDFTDHQEALEKIRETAKKLLREPEAQVLYWLTVVDFDKLGDLG